MTEKSCTICGQVLPLSAFASDPTHNDGHRSLCKQCSCARQKAWRLRNLNIEKAWKLKWRNTAKGKAMQASHHAKRRAKDPQKVCARTAVSNSIRDGKLKREPCEVCGEKAQAHHEDYSRPLEVRWLCSKHHSEHHQKAVRA